MLVLKEAGNSLQHFSNCYTLEDEYYRCLTSDATIMLSYKCPIIVKQVAGVLAGHTVAMVSYCATKSTATCSSMIGQCFDTMSLASADIEWL